MAQELERGAAVDTRVERLTRDSDLSWVVVTLTDYRDKVLNRWLEAAADQPFHRERRERAVADHIPRLFDALLDLMRRHTPRWIDPRAPLDDPGVVAAAEDHARMRAEQGLAATDVVVEFRLLRQEILHVLRERLPDDVPAGDLLGAELLVNDAIDGAITIGLATITQHIETVREDFLATTVHEVRQPITVIKGAAQLAVRMLSRPEPNVRGALDELQRVESGVNRMATQLTALVDASRLALGRLELALEPVDLRGLLRLAVAQLDSDASTRVALSVAVDSDTTGHWDAPRLEQVLGNLLSNAAKYSPAQSPIEVTLQSQDHSIVLSVRDHGIGIAADELPQLFQRYSRTRTAVARGIEGLGLGLYLTRGIVEAHGGRIRIESPGVGLGTTATLILPRDPEGRRQ